MRCLYNGIKDGTKCRKVKAETIRISLNSFLKIYLYSTNEVSTSKRNPEHFLSSDKLFPYRFQKRKRISAEVLEGF